MTTQNIFMYSGQGSQFYLMGKELYEHNDRFRFWMNYCNDIISPLIGDSIIDFVLYRHKRFEVFDSLLYSNPALISVEFSLSKILFESGIFPDFLLGYSLGELSCAVVSESLDLEDGLIFSVELARLLEKDHAKTGMLAIFASPSTFYKYGRYFEETWLASNNFNGSFVVSGTSQRLEILKENLQRHDITTQVLPVKFGFHCKLVERHKSDIESLLKKLKFSDPKIKIISSLLTNVIENLTKEHFWEVIRKPVEFEATIKNMLNHGDFRFIDVGPSGSLATITKYILGDINPSVTFQIMNQFNHELKNLENLLASISGNESNNRIFQPSGKHITTL